MDRDDDVLRALAELDPARGEAVPEIPVETVLERVDPRRARRPDVRWLTIGAAAAAIVAGALWLTSQAGTAPESIETLGTDPPPSPSTANSTVVSSSTRPERTTTPSTVHTTSTPTSQPASTPTTGAPEPEVIGFDFPPPPGEPWDPATETGGELEGDFGGIDFEAGQWRWEAGDGGASSNHAIFAEPTQAEATFTFVDGANHFVKLTAVAGTDGLLTITDEQGQSKRQRLVAGRAQVVNTGWDTPSTTIRVRFETGDHSLKLDDLVYR